MSKITFSDGVPDLYFGIERAFPPKQYDQFITQFMIACSPGSFGAKVHLDVEKSIPYSFKMKMTGNDKGNGYHLDNPNMTHTKHNIFSFKRLHTNYMSRLKEKICGTPLHYQNPSKW